MFNLTKIRDGVRQAMIPVLILVAIGQAVCVSEAQAQFVPNMPAPNVPTLAPPSTTPPNKQPGPTPSLAPSKKGVNPQGQPTGGKQEAPPAAGFLQGLAAHVLTFIKPLLQELTIVMPMLWTPFRIAFLLMFLIFYVGYHVLRQQRARLEAQQEGQLSAAEAEFGRDHKDNSHKEATS